MRLLFTLKAMAMAGLAFAILLPLYSAAENHHQVREMARIFDSIIAAGTLNDKLSSEDIDSLWQCAIDGTDGMDEKDRFENVIPILIDQALAKAESDTGRILEFTEETELSLGENYKATIKAATVVCLVADWIDIDNNIPAAYASHLVDNNAFIGPDNALEANWTMLLEADVMELGLAGMLHVPRTYCMDLENPYDLGVELGSESNNVFPWLRVEEVPRTLSFGTRSSTIISLRNRVSWMAEVQDGVYRGANLFKYAYKNPKVELIALANTIEDDLCVNMNYPDCYDRAYLQYRGKPGFEKMDPSAKYGIIAQYMYMVDAIWNWKDFKDRVSKEDLGIELEFLDPEDNIYNEYLPFVWADGLAGQGKNSMFPSVQANPYYSTDQLKEKTAVPDDQRLEILKCIKGQLSEDDQDQVVSSGSTNAAIQLPSAILRRLYEYSEDVPKSTRPNEWAKIGNNIALDESSLEQTVTWNQVTNQLEEGNLTTKIMGKTADWLMVTNPIDDSPLRRLLKRQEEEVDAHSISLSHAVHLDNPCADAVSNIEVYLLMFSMALAACGGVTAVLHSVHHLMYWARYMVQGQMKQRPSSVSGWRRLLPTYELLLAVLGCTVFFVLYVPVYAQVVKEREIASYRTSDTNAQVIYTVDSPDIGYYPDKPVLVTMAYSETQCETSRPGLLLTIFLVGLALGLIVNAPFFWCSYKAMVRYAGRLKTGEDEIPPHSTMADETLRLFSPLPKRFGGSEEDDDDDDDAESTQSLVGSTNSLVQSKDGASRDVNGSSQGDADDSSKASSDKGNSSRDDEDSLSDLEEAKKKSSVYPNVLYQKRTGNLILSGDGISFNCSNDDSEDKTIYSLPWEQLMKTTLTKADKPLAKIKVIVKNDTNGVAAAAAAAAAEAGGRQANNTTAKNAIFQLSDRSILLRLRDDIATRVGDLTGDLTETTFSQTSFDFSSGNLNHGLNSGRSF